MDHLNWLYDLDRPFSSSLNLSYLYDLNEMSVMQKYGLYRILQRGGVI